MGVRTSERKQKTREGGNFFVSDFGGGKIVIFILYLDRIFYFIMFWPRTLWFFERGGMCFEILYFFFGNYVGGFTNSALKGWMVVFNSCYDNVR